MNITDRERTSANKLIELFLANKDFLPYANIGADNTYLGWVSDFRLKDTSGQKIHLDLSNNNDVFLLFILAMVWSRTGPWENSAFFVAHLKIHQKHIPDYWLIKEDCDTEMKLSSEAAIKIKDLVKGIEARKKISFRKDIYNSLHILAINWPKIIHKLEQAKQEGDYEPFMNHMRGIAGLGVGCKRMLIKIPLILRELRCQAIHPDIPGEYCCVPDARVYEAAKKLEIRLPISTTFDGLKASSSKIYQLFGDLYDLPLFAYGDLQPVYR